MRTIDISSFDDYLKRFTKHIRETAKDKNRFFLYRGEENAEWQLLPRIARYSCDNPASVEKNLLKEFRRLGRPYVPRDVLDNDWDCLALAQHHGLPTRLLDWSTSPLVALWFAFQKRLDVKSRCVWVLMLTTDEVLDTTLGQPFDQKVTRAFKPSHITSRITAQHGWFTNHKYMQDKEKFVALNKNRAYKHVLARFVFDNALRDQMLISLDFVGINAYTLFPDVDGLSRYLDWKLCQQPTFPSV